MTDVGFDLWAETGAMADGGLDAGDEAGEVVEHGAQVLADELAGGLGVGEVDPEEGCT